MTSASSSRRQTTVGVAATFAGTDERNNLFYFLNRNLEFYSRLPIFLALFQLHRPIYSSAISFEHI